MEMRDRFPLALMRFKLNQDVLYSVKSKNMHMPMEVCDRIAFNA
jgi:hypothetical protein